MKLTTLAICFAVALMTTVASAQTDTTFTYQGELKENGNPANGSYDFTFTHWSGSPGGFQLGSAYVVQGVQVVDGRFTVGINLDPPGIFVDALTFLETEVNGTTLSPRTPITAAPRSISTRGIFVDEDENIGIGTGEPKARLHIQDTDAKLRLEDLNSIASYTELRDDTEARFALQKVNGEITGGNDVVMDIDPIPLNGIGNAALRIFRSTNTFGEKRVSFFRGNNTTETSAVIGVDGQDSWFQLHGGDLGIGTASPNFLLHVDGTAGKPGGGAWSVASDVRLKKNIQPIDNALSTLLRLRGVTFEYVDPAAIQELPGERIGMIAQEVEKVVPDWVDVRADGYKTVTHRGFEALTVEALRELREEKNTEVESLRAENVALRTENDSIRARLESLESLVEQLASTQR